MKIKEIEHKNTTVSSSILDAMDNLDKAPKLILLSQSLVDELEEERALFTIDNISEQDSNDIIDLIKLQEYGGIVIVPYDIQCLISDDTIGFEAVGREVLIINKKDEFPY